MSTPIYESDRDRSKQLAVATYLGQCWASTPISAPPLAQHDYAMCRYDARDGKLYAAAYIEVKCRSTLHLPFWVSLTKYSYLSTLSQTTNCPAFIVIHAADTNLIHYIRVGHNPPSTTTGGRLDRPDDPNAIEIMACIPADQISSAGSLPI